MLSSPVTLKTVGFLLKTAGKNWMDDSCPRLGAAISYYTVFAVPPLLVIVVYVVSLVFDPERVRSQLLAELGGLVGQQGAETLRQALTQSSPRQTDFIASLIAMATLVVTSTGLFMELQGALNLVWGVEEKPGQGVWGFIKNRLLSFTMVLVIGFLLLVSLLVSAAISAASGYLNDLMPGLDIVWLLMNTAISFAVISVLFAMMFKVLPDVSISWRDVWIGAIATALLFTAGKTLLGWYLGRSTAVTAYGAAGSVVLILLWVYYSSQILFFGAELTQAYANRCGVRLHPKPHARWIEPRPPGPKPQLDLPAETGRDRRAVLVAELKAQVETMKARYHEMRA
jgi:membrane protein